MPRCHVCRNLTGLQIETTSRASHVCRRCARALPRVLELEEREADLMRSLQGILRETDDAALRKRLKGVVNHGGDERARSRLAEARDILMQVAHVVAPYRGKTHAVIQEMIAGEIVYACHMPGCELCQVAHLAQAFLAEP